MLSLNLCSGVKPDGQREHVLRAWHLSVSAIFPPVPPWELFLATSSLTLAPWVLPALPYSPSPQTAAALCPGRDLSAGVRRFGVTTSGISRARPGSWWLSPPQAGNTAAPSVGDWLGPASPWSKYPAYPGTEVVVPLGLPICCGLGQMEMGDAWLDFPAPSWGTAHWSGGWWEGNTASIRSKCMQILPVPKRNPQHLQGSELTLQVSPDPLGPHRAWGNLFFLLTSLNLASIHFVWAAWGTFQSPAGNMNCIIWVIPCTQNSWTFWYLHLELALHNIKMNGKIHANHLKFLFT